MKIEFIKTHKDAKLPKKNYKNPLTGDAGFDIFLTENLEVLPRKSIIVNVGLKVGFITPGYWFRIEGRSGLGFKQDLSPFFGIIDNSYRGNVGIKIYNDSYDIQTVKKGKGIAQLIVYKMIDCEIGWTKQVSEVGEDARGDKGFGSSDEQLRAKICTYCNEINMVHPSDAEIKVCKCGMIY